MTVFGPRQTTLVIPMSTIERVGAQLLADGRIRRGYLGVGLHGIRLDEALAASLSLPDRRAIMVVSVDPNGPARTAGVLVGDVIVEFDGELCPACEPICATDARKRRQVRGAQDAACRPDRHSQSRDRSKPGAVTARRNEIGGAGSAIAVELSMDDAELAERVRMMLIAWPGIEILDADDGPCPKSGSPMAR